MSKWAEIAKKPTSLRQEFFDEYLELFDERLSLPWKPSAPSGWHESCLRAFHIVEEVKRLLELETPPSVIRQAIAAMEE